MALALSGLPEVRGLARFHRARASVLRFTGDRVWLPSDNPGKQRRRYFYNSVSLSRWMPERSPATERQKLYPESGSHAARAWNDGTAG